MMILNSRSLLALMLLICAAPSVPAQVLSASVKSDSVVAVVAEAQGLRLVPRGQLPFFGTFWVIRNSVPCVSAPLPCPPLDENLPVYAISDDQFLVDETAEPLQVRRSRISLTAEDYTAVVQEQLAGLMDHVVLIQEAESRQLNALNGEAPPPVPGEGGGGGSGDDSYTNSPPIYTLGLGLCAYPPIVTSNSITIAVTNTPDSGWLTNVYDLFCTTNMASLSEPALCITNWAWLARSISGQTNFSLTNPGFPECYFRLGTMQDSDSDGLTDAYEILTSHTQTENPDTDGDGLSDGYEVLVGLSNPRIAATLPTLTGCSVPACPIP